jgi:hypothetical protein
MSRNITDKLLISLELWTSDIACQLAENTQDGASAMFSSDRSTTFVQALSADPLFGGSSASKATWKMLALRSRDFLLNHLAGVKIRANIVLRKRAQFR